MGSLNHMVVLYLGFLVFWWVLFFGFFFVFDLFRAAPAAYGGSQAGGGIRAAGLHHSSRQHGILNPLNKSRDRTCILMDASQIRFC